MKKQLILGILVVVVIIVGIIIARHKQPQATTVQTQTTATTTATTTAPTSTTQTKSPTLEDQAWAIFQKYLTAAKNHDLPTLSSVSYQLSAVCKDPAQQTACFQRMDAVYAAAKDLQEKEFTHILSDSKQTILYTDWGTVYNSDVTIAARVLVYFARTSNGTLEFLSFNPSQAEYISHTDSTGKVLTQSQIDMAVASSTAADDKALNKDSDGNGWWDSIQSLFN